MQLELSDPKMLVGSFDRPNLIYRVERRHDTIGQIRSILQPRAGECGIIYCISRSKTEETSGSLNALGYRTLPYHAGLDADTRKKHQDAFIHGDVDIIVATVAFGMGIDKSNVRYVIHAEMPCSVEAWQQESGRAGRDGLEAECWLLYSGRDVSTWKFLIDQSESGKNRDASLAALARMESFFLSQQCRHIRICEHFGEQLDQENCGACDVCLKEMAPVARSCVTAQKILSGVYRQKEGFGAGYTCQVLRGSRNKKILANGHDRLSTWGRLKEESEHVVRSWIDQLIALEFLMRHGEYSVLKITDAGWRLLRGEESVILTWPRPLKNANVACDPWEGVDRKLFEHLRRIRLLLAMQRGVRPYVIFGDVTLRELAKLRPTAADAMLTVSGIGKQKQKQFGGVFAKEIARWCAEHELESDLRQPPSTVCPR